MLWANIFRLAWRMLFSLLHTLMCGSYASQKVAYFPNMRFFFDRPHICVAYGTVQIPHYANFLRLHENSDFKDKLIHGELRINHLYVKISGVMDKVTQGWKARVSSSTHYFLTESFKIFDPKDQEQRYSFA